MLVSKLRVVFENASGELELWNKAASAQVDSQLRERRRGFKRRRESARAHPGRRRRPRARASPSSRRRTQRLQQLLARSVRELAAALRDAGLRRRRASRWRRRAAPRLEPAPTPRRAAAAAWRRRAVAAAPLADRRRFAERVDRLAAQRTAATRCRGRARATRTASGCPRSCCSRRRWRPCSATTRASCSAFPTWPRWPPRRWTTCWRCGAAWATTAARATCTAARRRSCAEHGGALPAPAARRWPTLPGIGRSTAAAIAAFCFGERAAILDGNVKRVLTRVLGFDGDLAERGARARAVGARRRRCCPSAASSAYTQGLMDLGATLCTPRAPRCLLCPVQRDLRGARASGTPERYPVKTPQAQARPARATCCCGCDGATRCG